MWGRFGKPLKRAIWNTLPLHAVLTTCLRFSSVLDGACSACCLLLSTGSYHVCKFTPWAVASPDAPQKPLVRKRARSGGAEWMLVARHWPGSRAKKPLTAGLQQPACTHKEHQIVGLPMGHTSQHGVGACESTQAAGLGKIEELCSHSQAGGCLPEWGPGPSTCGEGQRRQRFGLGIMNGPNCAVHVCVHHPLLLCAQRCDHLPPTPTHTFLKQPFHRFQKVHKGNYILGRIGPKLQKTWEKCQNPTSWHILNCPREICNSK